MSTDANEPGFLARWSRMKRGEAVAPIDPPVAATADRVAPAKSLVPDQLDDTSSAEADTPKLELPKLEDLTASSDFTVFLQKGVPLELQRLALRRAWSLDPAIRDFIEVAENQYDWNAVDGVPGFGPLDPGTDLKRLLAQATGQLDSAEADVAAAEAPVSQPHMMGNQPGIAAQNDAPTEDHPRTGTVQPMTEAPEQDGQPAAAAQVPHAPIKTTAGDDLAPAMDPPVPHRRRHGGALPS